MNDRGDKWDTLDRDVTDAGVEYARLQARHVEQRELAVSIREALAEFNRLTEEGRKVGLWVTLRCETPSGEFPILTASIDVVERL